MCYCGKQSTASETCIDGSIRCSCVRSNKECTSKCYCKESKCQNRNEESVTDCAPPATLQQSSTCRCGEKKRKTESGYKGCGNIDGQRKTKCPCFEKGLECATSCTCYNCINKYGVSLKIVSDAGTKKSRKRRKDTLIERFSAEKQIVDGGEELKKGHWTTKENIVLMICLVTLNKSVFQITADNIEIIYRAIANKDNEKPEKSPKQFIGKLKYERSKLH